MARLSDFRDFDVALPGGGTAYARLTGRADGPLVVVAGGISADRAPASDAGRRGWWEWAVGPGAPVDTDRLAVLAIDWLPAAGAAPDRPVTTQDQARAIAAALDALGRTRADAFVGASYGGCVGLAFAELFPERIGRLVALSAPHRAHPTATAWRGVQRRILELGREAGREAEALSLARQLAMTTYRTTEELGLRFGGAPPPAVVGAPHPVCDWLIARGEAHAARADAQRQIILTDSLDRHAVEPERVAGPLTVVGFTDDRLVPIADLHELAARASNLCRFVEAPSVFGHDAFLKEREVVGRALRTALLPLPACPEFAA
ncbi:MAG: homoserine O-succinyltransferase [Alphaproteobacteria bacterium]|nr:homoserine O-succinyltransferase [Alphaproteobacteria bacterium]MBU1526212.1 homoserine O-succinyltransferase [Alphaproteobacteria bacterium]MBU2350564.1 homoserine O-succinyltransferase [Alphaproteobacteria bacterium]MBU2382109.1 homoserine O-succinyltransferase [Alphaproteobacteria bacterium]